MKFDCHFDFFNQNDSVCSMDWRGFESQLLRVFLANLLWLFLLGYTFPRQRHAYVRV